MWHMRHLRFLYAPICSFRSGVALLPLCLALAGAATQAAQLKPELEALQAYEQARAEISSQRYDRAEILLERVLMLYPEHAEARIELALLMARRGHIDGAQALVQSLLDDPRTEPDYILALRNLKDQIQKGPLAVANPYALGSQGTSLRLSTAGVGQEVQVNTKSAEPVAWRSEASFSVSSNPLARTSSTAISITLPDGPLSLPLTQTARSGSLAGATLSRTTPTGGAELTVQRTELPDTTIAARALLWGQLPLMQWLPESWRPANLPPMLVYAQAQRGLDGQHRTMTGLTSVLGAQRLSLSRYEEYGISDRGTVVRAEHKQTRWSGIEMQASIERSNSSLGPQGYWRAGVSADHALGNGRKLLAQLTHQQDTYAYSALLQNGAQRRLTTAYVAYEQHIPMKSGKVLIWRVFSGERRSNLELFNYNEYGAQLSMMQNWR
jgi:hypothetical protein